MLKESSEVHWLKVPSPIDVSVSGSETLFNFLQFANVYFSIEVIPIGIEIEEKLSFMKKMLNQEKEIKLIINELKNVENKTLKKEQIQNIQKRLEQLI